MNIQFSDGSLYQPDSGPLLFLIWYLEKGRSICSPLPGFDTDASLAKLSAAIERINARGYFFRDSFRTNRQAFQLPEIYKKQLRKLAKDRRLSGLQEITTVNCLIFAGQVCQTRQLQAFISPIKSVR